METWLIDGRRVQALQALYRESLKADARKAYNDAMNAPRTKAKQAGQVAVLSLFGMLERVQSFVGYLSGGTATSDFGKMFDQALADPAVSSILILVDSPGGTVPGTPELADKIYAARSKKPIIAIADSLCASAAYWIGSAASQLYVTPSGEVGSIGCFSIHMDYSKMLAEDGIKPTIFQAPEFKAEFNPYQPLSDAAKQTEQASVERVYSEFVAAVARNRGVSMAKVKSDFGQGRVVDAKTAVTAGMVDGIMTADQLSRQMLERYATNRTAKKVFSLPPAQLAAKARNEKRTEEVRRMNTEIAADKAAKERKVMRVISGHVATWNEPAWQREGESAFWEMRSRGCFDSVLNSSDEVVFTINHAYDNPLARRSDFSLELKADEIGLIATVRLPWTKECYDLVKAIDRGEATGWSLTYKTSQHAIKPVLFDGKQVRLVTNCKIHEVCIVMAPERPAYPSSGPVLLTGVC